jgi:hypothetical protein
MLTQVPSACIKKTSRRKAVRTLIAISESLRGKCLNAAHDSGAGRISTPLLVLVPGAGGILAGVLGFVLAPDAGTDRLFDNIHWTAGTLAAAALAWLSVRWACR